MATTNHHSKGWQVLHWYRNHVLTKWIHIKTRVRTRSFEATAFLNMSSLRSVNSRTQSPSKLSNNSFPHFWFYKKKNDFIILKFKKQTWINTLHRRSWKTFAVGQHRAQNKFKLQVKDCSKIGPKSSYNFVATVSIIYAHKHELHKRQGLWWRYVCAKNWEHLSQAQFLKVLLTSEPEEILAATHCPAWSCKQWHISKVDPVFSEFFMSTVRSSH